jgi:hypothetical protein
LGRRWRRALQWIDHKGGEVVQGEFIWIGWAISHPTSKVDKRLSMPPKVTCYGSPGSRRSIMLISSDTHREAR